MLRLIDGTWDPPRYKIVQKLPYIPNESEIDALIAGTGLKTATFLRTLKETGIRISEAVRLKWSDVDFSRGIVRVTASKGSNPRICRISNTLVNKLTKAKATNKVEDPERIFGKRTASVRRVYSKQRNRIAEKLQNPNIRKIAFHTLRHWYGTMRYHATKDLLRVQKELGHKSISSTMRFIDYEKAYCKEYEDSYICKTASNADEASELIELGFDYVTEMDGLKLFRKPKNQWGE